MRTSRVMSIAASVTLLIAASAVIAVEAFAGDRDHHDHDRHHESREYPHIHGDWRKPYIPPRTHDSGTRYDDDSYHLDDDDQDQRKNTDYLSDDESDDE